MKTQQLEDARIDERKSLESVKAYPWRAIDPREDHADLEEVDDMTESDRSVRSDDGAIESGGLGDENGEYGVSRASAGRIAYDGW